MDRIATWYLAVVAVSFPVLKIWTYVAFHGEGEPHSLKVRQVLFVYHWLASWF